MTHTKPNAEPAAAPPRPLFANDNRPIAGVAIDVDTTGDAPRYLVQLLSPALDVLKTAATTGDETAARRAWILIARALRRPRYVAKAGGGFRALEKMTGNLVGRAPLARRGRRVPLRRRHSSRRRAAMSPPALETRSGG